MDTILLYHLKRYILSFNELSLKDVNLISKLYLKE